MKFRINPRELVGNTSRRYTISSLFIVYCLLFIVYYLLFMVQVQRFYSPELASFCSIWVVSALLTSVAEIGRIDTTIEQKADEKD